MTPGIRPLVAGNWKMNGTSASLNELRSIGNGFMSGLDAETEAVVCVPATLLQRAAEILSRTTVRAGGEDCHPKE
ncbi:MAG: triose-phosphate isomerase, partial [Mesorhizobium sp.]